MGDKEGDREAWSERASEAVMQRGKDGKREGASERERQ